MPTSATLEAPALAAPVRRRFTVAEWQAMGDASILPAEERSELIGGEVILMTPIGVQHARAVTLLTRWLVLGVGERARVSVQNPLRLDEYSEPQPDLVLFREHAGLYAHSSPAAEDVLLVIEVSDSSYAHDRQVKLPLFARRGVPEAWIWNLGAARLEVYRDANAASGIYRQTLTLQAGDRVAPLAFPDVQLAVASILN
jgi:Uma2 family endonuclease